MIINSLNSHGQMHISGYFVGVGRDHHLSHGQGCCMKYRRVKFREYNEIQLLRVFMNERMHSM